ncbi:hypothetical protein JCM5353_005773 [Sporobolomyces roseus]
MSFRSTLVRCAKEVQHRSPAIRFPDRKHANHESHSAQPHPCAPQSVIDQYFPDAPKPSNAQTSPSAQNSSSYGGPVDPSQQGQEPQADSQKSSSGGGGGSSGGGSSSAMEEWEMPSRLKRTRYAPTEMEIDAIQSGGATESTPVTRETKLTWYTEQI